MRPLRVLVTGAGGDVCRGVIQCLEQSKLVFDITVVGADPHSYSLYEDRTSFIVPPCAASEYVDSLCMLLVQQNIDVLIPTVDSEILRISQAAQYIENITTARVCVGNADSVGICDDKLLTSRFLEENGFAFPRTSSTADLESGLPHNIVFPVIAKSRHGGGSKKVWRIEDSNSLAKALLLDDMIIQEYLDIDDNEYTVSVYIGVDNEAKGCCILKRRLKNGSTVFAERVNNRIIEKTAIQIAKTLKMPFLNIQGVLRGEKEFVPFEFNGRFSGTVSISERVFNAPDLWIRERILGESIFPSQSDEMFVAFREQAVHIVPMSTFKARGPING